MQLIVICKRYIGSGISEGTGAWGLVAKVAKYKIPFRSRAYLSPTTCPTHSTMVPQEERDKADPSLIITASHRIHQPLKHLQGLDYPATTAMFRRKPGNENGPLTIMSRCCGRAATSTREPTSQSHVMDS